MGVYSGSLLSPYGFRRQKNTYLFLTENIKDPIAETLFKEIYEELFIYFLKGMPYIWECEDTTKHRQVGRHEKQDYENNAMCLQKPPQNFENACPAPGDPVPQISRSSVAQLFLDIYFFSIGGSSCGKTTKWIPNDWCQPSVTLPRCNMAFRRTKTEKGGKETKRQPQKTERVGGNKNKPTHKHPPKKNGDVTKTSSATKVLSRAVLGTSETSAVTQTSARSKRKQTTKKTRLEKFRSRTRSNQVWAKTIPIRTFRPPAPHTLLLHVSYLDPLRILNLGLPLQFALRCPI